MHGIVKVNTGSALNVAYTDAVQGVLIGAGASTDPRNYLRSARDRIARVSRSYSGYSRFADSPSARSSRGNGNNLAQIILICTVAGLAELETAATPNGGYLRA
jgi:hypothetical protein